MAGISITLGGNFSALNTLQSKAAETVAKLKNGFAERIGHKMFDGLLASAASVARSIPAAVKLSIDAASDLGETVSKVNVIFGEGADAIMSWSTSSAEALGLSQQKALAAAADFGGLFRVMGIGEAETRNMSTSLVELASDLASFNNASVPDAIAAIGSALRGETEPMTRFNVVMNDTTLKAAALAKGLYDGKGSLDPTTKALAAYAVMLGQTADAQGDFTRTSDGLANSTKTIGARFENLTAEIGEKLLPIALEFSDWIKDIDTTAVVDGVGQITAAVGELREVLEELRAGEIIGFIASALGGFESDDFEARKVFPGKKGEAGTEEEQAAKRAAAQARVVADAEKAKAAAEASKANAEFRKQIESIQSGMLSVLDAEQARMAAISAHEAELALIEAKTAGDEERVTLLEREAAVLAKIGELTAAGVDGKEARGRAEALAAANEELTLAERRRKQEEIIAEAKKVAGFGDPDSETIDDLMSKLTASKSALDSSAYRSTITSVDSMQRIGGGGGFASGGLDYARTQTDLQRQMVASLRAIEEKAREAPLED